MTFTAGQILTAAQLNGVTQQATVIVFTNSGTLTSVQAANARTLRIWGCNGGGGGGGVAATSTSQSAHGGGGAAGAAAFRDVTVSGLTFPLAVTVGAAGAAGSAGANAGGAGGQSKVIDNNGAGSTLWTPGVQSTNQGGSGGAASGTLGDATSAGFNGAVTGSVADVVMPGAIATNPTRYSAALCTRIGGASSLFGCGGNPGNGGAGSPPAAGFGGGGGGAYIVASTAAAAGAAGAAGVVIIELVA